MTSDVASSGVQYKFDNGNSIGAGLQHAEDSYQDPTPTVLGGTAQGNYTTNQAFVNGSYGVLDNQVILHGNVMTSVDGEAADPQYPNLATVGADYKVTQKTTLFVDEQVASGAQQSDRSTQLGVKTEPWDHGQIRHVHRPGEHRIRSAPVYLHHGPDPGLGSEQEPEPAGRLQPRGLHASAGLPGHQHQHGAGGGHTDLGLQLVVRGHGVPPGKLVHEHPLRNPELGPADHPQPVRRLLPRAVPGSGLQRQPAGLPQLLRDRWCFRQYRCPPGLPPGDPDAEPLV